MEAIINCTLDKLHGKQISSHLFFFYLLNEIPVAHIAAKNISTMNQLFIIVI